jgi:hypothetical protein
VFDNLQAAGNIPEFPSQVYKDLYFQDISDLAKTPFLELLLSRKETLFEQ